MNFKFAVIFAVVVRRNCQPGFRPNHHKPPTRTRTVSGCLQSGDSADEFKLTTAAGATWEIKSDNVKLVDHVGHTVTITGVVSNATMHGMKEDAKAEAKEHGVDKGSTEHGHMAVTNLKMVSDSCKNSARTTQFLIWRVRPIPGGHEHNAPTDDVSFLEALG